jgi:hypothetical protein
MFAGADITRQDDQVGRFGDQMPHQASRRRIAGR